MWITVRPYKHGKVSQSLAWLHDRSTPFAESKEVWLELEVFWEREAPAAGAEICSMR